MSRVWLIGDTHWWHKNIEEYCGRPQDYNGRLFRSWERGVEPEDTVIHLGDVLFGPPYNVVTSLPGYKILVRGNHDKKSSHWYRTHGFVCVVEQMVMDVGFTMSKGTPQGNKRMRVLFTHRPVPLEMRFEMSGTGVDVNIHGHFHNNKVWGWERSLRGILEDRHYLFCLEEVGYRPVLLKNVFRDGTVRKTMDVLTERQVSPVDGGGGGGGEAGVLWQDID